MSVALTKLDDSLLDFFRTLDEVAKAADALRNLGARGAFLNRLDHFCTLDEVALTRMVRDATLHAEAARTELHQALDMLRVI